MQELVRLHEIKIYIIFIVYFEMGVGVSITFNLNLEMDVYECNVELSNCWNNLSILSRLMDQGK